MSDKPNTKDQSADDASQSDAQWVMPEAVFRSSEGYTPNVVRSEAITDEIKTESGTGGSVHDTDPQPKVSDDVSTAITEEIPVYDAKSEGGGFRSFLFILVTIALVAALLVVVTYYFLSSYGQPDGTF